MNAFSSIFILRLACMEGTAIVSFMIGFVTRNQYLFTIGFTIAMLILLVSPSKEKLSYLLHLTNQESRDLD